MEYLLLVVGFILLLYSGKFLVKGSVALASLLKVSKLVIGVTVVSFGTSAPELFVSLLAANTGEPEIALGNVIGSNIANIALVLALTAVIFPIVVKRDSVKIDAPFMLIVSGLFYFFIADGTFTRLEGVIFVVLLITYIIFLLRHSRKNPDIDGVEEENISIGLAVIYVLGSALGLAFGSHLLVSNVEIIALNLGVSERVISITVVAFGTSLPELTTSVIAAFKKEMDISIGNIIGSNIFNLLAVIGITGLSINIPVSEKFIQVDVLWMLAISVMLFLAILPLKGGKITRLKGVVMFAVYCVYIYFLITTI